MGNSDVKKINYELFEKTITKLTDLKMKLIDEKENLDSTNITLVDECNWKGVSRNYYADITIKQKAAFEKINKSLEQFISDLNATLDNFDNLDKNIASSFEE